ncbi:MAG: glycosyltransferase [Actinobacteria bacterium]|nr:glycosyltransferase [Actinomycetota bacterium]
MNQDRIDVWFMAHSISAHGGGMERMNFALLNGLNEQFQTYIVAGEGLSEVPRARERIPIRIAKKPAFARIAGFYFRSPTKKDLTLTGGISHTCGAINRGGSDIATVHLCQADAKVAKGESHTWRYLNARIARSFGRVLERRNFTPGRTGLLVAVSDSVADQLRRHYPDIEVRVIPNGVDEHRFPFTQRSIDSPLRILMVTGDFALKGVGGAIRALAMALDKTLILTVVGKGDAAPYLKLAQSLGVAERVSFTGPLHDVVPEYAQHNIILCNSTYESFGLFIVEAALTGCAVLSTDVGIARRLVGDNEAGAIFDGSVSQLAGWFDTWSQNRNHVQSMGQLASRRAQEFSLARMIESYEELYQEIAAGRA